MNRAASACAGRAASGRQRRPAPASRVAALSLLWLLGCGARSDPPDEGGEEVGGASAGLGPVDPTGACAACDGRVVCTHCYIQAYDVTYRCRPTQPAPSASCFGLGESHVDQFGAAYTCYYCP